MKFLENVSQKNKYHFRNNVGRKCLENKTDLPHFFPMTFALCHIEN